MFRTDQVLIIFDILEKIGIRIPQHRYLLLSFAWHAWNIAHYHGDIIFSYSFYKMLSAWISLSLHRNFPHLQSH